MMSLTIAKHKVSIGRTTLLVSYLNKPDSITPTKNKTSADTFFAIYLTFDNGPVIETEELIRAASYDSIL